MKQKSKLYGINWLLLFLALSLFACSTPTGSRFYTGRPLSQNEVAFLYLYGACRLNSITREGQEKIHFKDAYRFPGELLPGSYILEVSYNYMGEIGGAVNLPLHAEAGHTYSIWPSFPEKKKWRPFIVDNLNNDDFSKISKSNQNYVKEKSNIYFKGKRPPIEVKQELRNGGVYNYWDIPFWY